MTRSIKFRAWDKTTKRMGDWSELCAEECKGDLALVLEQPEEIALMQFTGLLDKNGKEIYEGDILHVNSIFNAEVVRRSDGAWQVGHTGESCGGLLEPECYKLEVIGNIYEDPELLHK